MYDIPMKIPIRINKRVTSIGIRDSIVALHFMFMGGITPSPQEHMQDYCYNALSDWEGLSGKGLSGFITDRMLRDVVHEEDMPDYTNILKTLEASIHG